MRGCLCETDQDYPVNKDVTSAPDSPQSLTMLLLGTIINAIKSKKVFLFNDFIWNFLDETR